MACQLLAAQVDLTGLQKHPAGGGVVRRAQQHNSSRVAGTQTNDEGGINDSTIPSQYSSQNAGHTAPAAPLTVLIHTAHHTLTSQHALGNIHARTGTQLEDGNAKCCSACLVPSTVFTHHNTAHADAPASGAVALSPLSSHCTGNRQQLRQAGVWQCRKPIPGAL